MALTTVSVFLHIWRCNMINNRLKKLSKYTKSIAQGNLLDSFDSHRFHYQDGELVSHIHSIRDQFIELQFDIQVISTQLHRSTANMTQVFNEQLHYVEQAYNASTTLKEANTTNLNLVDDLVSTSDQLHQDIQSLLASNHALNDSIEASALMIQQQLETLEGTISLINGIEKTNNTTIESVNHLTDSATKIASIFETVQSFYKQTGLLALNASIESARAGEAGKGFAVVASEIQQLAKQSSDSTASIVSIMEEIDTSIHQVLTASDKTSTAITQAVKNSKELKSDLTEITTSFKDQQEKSLHTNTLLKTNTSRIEHLNGTVRHIEGASRTLGEAVEELDDTIAHQYDQATALDYSKKDIEDASLTLDHMTAKLSDDLIDYLMKRIQEQSQQIQEHMEVVIDHNPILSEDNPLAHKQILDTVLDGSSSVEAIWSNRLDGSFIYSNPTNELESATFRDWFVGASKGSPHVSSVYISSLSKEPCVTICIPIKNQHQQVLTLIGADITLQLKL